VLASRIIDHCLETDPEAVTAFFYCTGGDDERSDHVNICKSLLAQMLPKVPHVAPYFMEKQATSGSVTLSNGRLVDKLLSVILCADARFFIILDGLDECEPKQAERTLTSLSQLVQECDKLQPGKLRLLIVSQNVSHVKDHLPTEVESFRLEHADNREDIEAFTRHHTRNLMQKQRLSIDQEETLYRNLCARSGGELIYHWLQQFSNVRQECFCTSSWF
jgi:hypothetical protein